MPSAGPAGLVRPGQSRALPQLLGYSPQRQGRHVGDPEGAAGAAWQPPVAPAWQMGGLEVQGPERVQRATDAKLYVRIKGQQTSLGPWDVDTIGAGSRLVRLCRWLVQTWRQ